MIYIDFGDTRDTTDLITATGDIIFAGNQGGGTVQVVVGNEDLSFDATKEHTVFEATGGTLRLGTADLNNNEVANVDADNKITIADTTGHSIEFRGADGIALEKATVKSLSKELSLTATGTVVPMPTLTPNQTEVYNSLDGADPGKFANSLKAYVSRGNDDERRAALEAALPTINSALFVASQRNVVTANRSIYNRLQFLQNRSARYSGFSRPQTVLLGQSSDCDPCEPVACDPCNPCDSSNSKIDAWFEGFGNFLRQSNTNTLQGYRANVGGFNLGIDKQLDRRTILGVSFGGAYADLKTNDRTQWGDVEQYLFSVYGSRTWDKWTFSFSSGYAFSDYNLTRHPGNVKINSKHDGDQYFAAFELAQKLRFNGYDLMPFYAIDFTRLEEGAYTEYNTTTNAVAANIDAQHSNSYLQTLGVKFGRVGKWRGWLLKPVVTAGWVHDYGSGNIYTTAQYDGGSKFTIKGASVHKNRALIGINFNIITSPNLTIYGGYNGEFANQFQTQTAQIGLNYAF
jgi:uncharacterized protein with beta-barrel porin domain